MPLPRVVSEPLLLSLQALVITICTYVGMSVQRHYYCTAGSSALCSSARPMFHLPFRVFHLYGKWLFLCDQNRSIPICPMEASSAFVQTAHSENLWAGARRILASPEDFRPVFSDPARVAAQNTNEQLEMRQSTYWLSLLGDLLLLLQDGVHIDCTKAVIGASADQSPEGATRVFRMQCSCPVPRAGKHGALARHRLN
jgi:hypothetical protein